MSTPASAVFRNYRLAEALAGDGRHRLYRGWYGDEQATVLLKVPTRQPASDEDIAALRREFDLLAGLAEDVVQAGVTRPLNFFAADGHCALLLEDLGEVPLAAAATPLPLACAVDCAIRLLRVLAALHEAGVVHRAVNPLSVLIHPGDGSLRLTDFSAAARDEADAGMPLAAPQYKTVLPYAAPELTGRVNRGCDCRTDFYAVGALLYELLTGRRPFVGDDPLELIHQQIARMPPAPHEISPAIPLPLSQIVMKLLAKPPEERYQSAAGLLRDLQRCRPTPAGTVEPFCIGENDASDRFSVPQRLYGREVELQTLNSAYEQARSGGSVLLLVAGYAGIGKTALIRELHVPVARSQGQFVSGKFDQLSRDVPYGALIEALRQLIQRKLTEAPARLARLRERLQALLGANAAVIAEVVPELELVLGKLERPSRLPPAEEQNRFTLVFENFVAALATAESPLVVFLDDLQWVDAATLHLLRVLPASEQIRHFLLVGAYRDNETDDKHPLLRTVAELRAEGNDVRNIALTALDAPVLSKLAADTLHIGIADVQPVTAVLMDKTGGNPFFVIQFLLAMHQEGLIRFDPASGQWRCQLQAIATAPQTDNVVELMSRKIDRLAPTARRLLTLAACVGNRFDAATLAAASGRPVQATVDELSSAAAEKLIAAQADGSFEFLHDRVQQAAYARIAEADRPQVHLAIGRRLWQDGGGGTGTLQTFDRIFDTASHLNLGARLIDSPSERTALARLNLAAGHRAKSAAAFQTARGYYAAGAALLDETHWRDEHALAFELNLETAQCEYLCGEFDLAQRRFDTLLARAADDVERASVHRLRLIQFENMGRYDDALRSAREGLALFGVLLPETATETQAALDREIEAIRLRLGNRLIDTLIELPVIADPGQKMVMRMLTDIWSSAYITGIGPLARLISATLVRLSIENGNTEESAYGYVTHAITAGPVHEDYEAARQWGDLALRVNERFGDLRLRAKIYQQFHAHVNLWCRPFADCIPYAKEACRSGLESGDFLYAAYGAGTESWPAFEAAQNLEQFVRDQEPNLALLVRLKNAGFADVLRLMLAWARALQGKTDAPTSLTGPGFDEEGYVRQYRDNPFFSLFHAVARLQLCYLLDDYAGAQRAAGAAAATADRLTGMLWSVQYCFWNGLTAAALCANGDGPQQQRTLLDLRTAVRSLSALAASAPENFLCDSLLLRAELARLAGEPMQAIDLYEQAIAAADRAAVVRQQALANELAGRFWTQRGNRTVSSVYLRTALHHYAALGAQAKVRRLVERHGEQLAEPFVPRGPASQAAAEPARHEALDIASIGRAAQAIAANVELEALVGQMVRLAVQNAAASGGVLIEHRDGTLYVAAECRADGAAIVLPRDRRLDAGRARCSHAVVNYVSRTQQTLLITDAADDGRFELDEYIAARKPKSILCLPILQQGRFDAIFYLENSLVADAFRPERIEIVRLLAAQAAMSLKSGRLVRQMEHEVAERRRAEEQLRAIETGMAAAIGGDFFRTLVRNLAQALQVRYAFVAECLAEPGITCSRKRVRSRAFWNSGEFGADFEYDVPGTPCAAVLDGEVCHHASDVQSRFPADTGLVDMGAVSYLGLPLTASDGAVVGHLAILDTKPMNRPELALSVMRLSAGRAGAELERLRAEEGLQRALSEVEQLKNRLQEENIYLRRELIANVSHDLRSPLASLRGYLDTLLLKENSLDEAQRRSYIEIAVRQAEHLQTLISELFDLARLDFQGYRINAEAVHLGELARDVLQKFQLAADRHQVALQLESQGEVGFVLADIALLERVLVNLLENALAHTPEQGSIALRLHADDGRLRIEVEDTGCGIPAADLPHIFERFYRVDKARTRDDRGSGLGLAIVKRIVELHGAEIRVDSKVEAGTRFWFELLALQFGAQAARWAER